MDKLKEEVEMYQLDDDEPIKNINTKLDYDDYWEKVGNITEGEGEWQVYSNLSRFVMSLGTAFNSGSEQERGFSRQSDIHRDPKRNKMSHNTLDCHMQVKYGMESKETVKKCPKCRERKDMMIRIKLNWRKKSSDVCHCKYSEISDAMILKCSKAWTVTKSDSKEEEEIYEKIGDGEKDKAQKQKRLDKLMETLSKRSTFYRLSDMSNVYESKEQTSTQSMRILTAR